MSLAAVSNIVRGGKLMVAKTKLTHARFVKQQAITLHLALPDWSLAYQGGA